MTEPSTDAALVMRDIRKVFGSGDNEVVALDDVDLTVGNDEIIALVGPSGSGKTTLCSVAGALLPATEGSVEVAGEELVGRSEKELTEFRRTQVGFVFQTVNLVPFLTARENLLVVDELAGRSARRGREAAERADQLLDELGLGDKGGALPATLSGGQRQRVAIGRALMNDPALVLFDEPTSALDSETGEQVVQLIKDEMKSRQTALIVTHDQRITHHADRTVRIEDGRITES